MKNSICILTLIFLVTFNVFGQDVYYPRSEAFNKDIDSNMLYVGKRMELKGVVFERAKTDLLPDSKKVLSDLIKFMNKYPAIRIRLEGHTDNAGDPQLNVNLTEDRVKEIKKYLVDQGIDEGRIEWIGYGGQRPLKKITEHTRSRRIEFEIIDK